MTTPAKFLDRFDALVVGTESLDGKGDMKTMTCKQLGGPCEFPLRGNSADEIIKALDRHLKDVVAEGDGTHQNSLNAMKERWKNPIAGLGWYKAAKHSFAALPES